MPGLDKASLQLMEKVKKSGSKCRFVMFSKGQNITGVRLFKRGTPETITQRLKQDGAKGTTIVHGAISGSGANPVFQLATADGFDKEPVKNATLRAFLQEATGTAYKATFAVVPTLPEVPEEDEEETGPTVTAAPESEPEPDPGPSQSEPEPSGDEKKYNTLLKALKPKLALCGKEKVGDIPAMTRMLSEAVGQADGGDFATAFATLGKLTGLVSAAQALIPLKGIKEALGGDEKTTSLLAHHTADEIAQLAKDLGGADTLGNLLESIDPGDLKGYVDDIGGAASLAAVVDTGFGGDAGKLTALSKAFDGDLGPLKTLIEKSRLGTAPKVLANLIKEGCEGDPTKLKAFSDAFANPDDAAKLATAIESGGLDGDGAGGGKDASDTLGRVLNEGLAGDPAKLKVLVTSFEGEPAKLKTMLSAFNDKPEPPPAKAGERLGKVYAQLSRHPEPPDHAGEIKKYFDEIEGFADKSPKYAFGTLDAKTYLSKADLLRQSATFEKKDKSAISNAPALASGFSSSMDHFCRHSREYCSFSDADGDIFFTASAKVGGANTVLDIEYVADNPNAANVNSKMRSAASGRAKDTTLWPEGTTDENIADYCDVAFKAAVNLDSSGAFVSYKTAGSGLTVVSDTPAFKSYEMEVESKTKLVVRIGIDVTAQKVTQFFPVSADPALDTIAWGDMVAIKKAMKF